MSENVLLHWVKSLEPAAQRGLALDLLNTSSAPGATLLARYAQAHDLQATEIAGLLPIALIQAQIAAHAVLEQLLGGGDPQRVPLSRDA